MKRSLSILTFLFISFCMYGTSIQVAKDTTRSQDSTHHMSKVGFAISGDFGGGIAATSAGNPSTSHLTYPSLTNAQIPNANYTSSAGLNVGFDLDVLFGKKRNLELSAGFTYIYSKGTADFDGYHVEYEAEDGNGNTFRRLLTANKLSESLSYGNMNIPVLFKYSTNPDKKLGAYIQLGPVLSLSSSAKGDMSASIDFEGVYHYDATGKNFVYSPTTAPGDWIITKQAIASELPPNQNVSAYFNQLYSRGYYVGLGETQSSKVNKVSYGVGGGAMIRAGGVYRATKAVNVLFGISAMILSNGRTVSNYTPITASNDLSTITLSNMLNGTSSLLTMQIGVNIGVQVRLIK